jgi:hypothetical protein
VRLVNDQIAVKPSLAIPGHQHAGSGLVDAQSCEVGPVQYCDGQLLNRYLSAYYCDRAVSIGVGLYGRGVIESDGAICKVVPVSELGADVGLSAERQLTEADSGFNAGADADAYCRPRSSTF